VKAIAGLTHFVEPRRGLDGVFYGIAEVQPWGQICPLRSILG